MKKNKMRFSVLLTILVMIVCSKRVYAQPCPDTGPSIGYSYAMDPCSGQHNPVNLTVGFSNEFFSLDIYMKVDGLWERAGTAELDDSGLGTLQFNISSPTDFMVVAPTNCSGSTQITVMPPVPTPPTAVFGSGYFCSGSGVAHVELHGATNGISYIIYRYQQQDIDGSYEYISIGNTVDGLFDINPYSPNEHYFVLSSADIECPSRSSPILITSLPVNGDAPKVVATPSDIICKSAEPITLVATNDFASVYRLYVGDELMSQSESGVFHLYPEQNTDYKVTSFNNLCGLETQAKSMSIVVLDIDPPVDQIVYKCNWEDVTIESNILQGTTRWYDSNNQLVGNEPILHVGTLARGTYIYKAEAVSSYGCVSLTKGIVTINVVEGCDENENYIRTFNTQYPSSSVNDIKTQFNDKNKILVNTQYFDGLGRLRQTVSHSNSPAGNDIVVHKEYNDTGLETLSFLPYVSPAAYQIAFRQDARQAQQNFYSATPANITGDSSPFSETVMEPSPLNRPVRHYSFGAAWDAAHNNKYVRYSYLINVHGTDASLNSEKIIAWRVTNNGTLIRADFLDGVIEHGGYYSSAQLSIKVTQDEQRNAIREYSNKIGQLILRKVQAVPTLTSLNDMAQWAATYYVYDNFGNLAFVIPPEAVKAIASIPAN